MNYLAHCFLAEPNCESIVGNLLGDFCKNVDEKTLSAELKTALANHRAVDKFTDHHDLVKEAKALFSPHRRRFAGIAVDVLFDHYLIKHWSTFSDDPYSEFKKTTYQLIAQGYFLMPQPMQVVMTSVVDNDWFASYEHLESTGYAIDRIAQRIRFKNNFAGSLEDIIKNERELEQVFLEFFPQLQRAVITPY
jgi:acyl carrier protein phosphodiesterase